MLLSKCSIRAVLYYCHVVKNHTCLTPVIFVECLITKMYVANELFMKLNLLQPNKRSPHSSLYLALNVAIICCLYVCMFVIFFFFFIIVCIVILFIII